MGSLDGIDVGTVDGLLDVSDVGIVVGIVEGTGIVGDDVVIVGLPVSPKQPSSGQ